jgi:hypothetical protein
MKGEKQVEETTGPTVLSDEQMFQVLDDVERRKAARARSDEIKKRGLATQPTFFKYVGTKPERKYSSPHETEFCRCEKADQGTDKFLFLRPGMYVRANDGDLLFTSADYVRVSDDEASTVAVVEDAVIVISHLVRLASMQTKEAEAAGDVQRTQEMIDTLIRRLEELKEEHGKAAAAVAATKLPLAKFLEGKPPQIAQATLSLAYQLSQERQSMVRKVAPYAAYRPPTLGTFELPTRKEKDK